jgi:hypothetical protein
MPAKSTDVSLLKIVTLVLDFPRTTNCNNGSTWEYGVGIGATLFRDLQDYTSQGIEAQCHRDVVIYSLGDCGEIWHTRWHSKMASGWCGNIA